MKFALVLCFLAACAMLAAAGSPKFYKDASDEWKCQQAKNHYVQVYRDFTAIPSIVRHLEGEELYNASITLLENLASKYFAPEYVEREDQFNYNENVQFAYSLENYIIFSAYYIQHVGVTRQHVTPVTSFCKALEQCGAEDDEKCYRVGGAFYYTYELRAVPMTPVTYGPFINPFYDPALTETIPVGGKSGGERYSVIRPRCDNVDPTVSLKDCPLADVAWESIRTDTGNNDFVQFMFNGEPAYNVIYQRSSAMNPDLDLEETVYTPLTPSQVPPFFYK